MSDTHIEPPEDNELFREAAVWFARMRGPNAERSRAEFDAWIARGAPHRRAYNRAAEIFAMGKVLTDERPDRRSASAPSHAPKRDRRIAAVALSVLTVAGLLLLLRARDIPRQAAGSQHGAQLTELETAQGRPRAFQLTDGSTVRLRASTRLEIAFGTSARRLLLSAGQARFLVAHEARPFIVLAGGGSVTAHGTIFDVGYIAPRRVAVKLIEGVVDVSLPRLGSKPGQPLARRLHRGDALTFVTSSSAAQSNQRVPSLSMLSASSAPLAAVEAPAADYAEIRIADLITLANRLASRPIRIADPLIGDERISGHFSIDNTALLADRLSALFDLRVDRSDPAALTLRRGQGRIFRARTP